MYMLLKDPVKVFLFKLVGHTQHWKNFDLFLMLCKG